MQVLIVIIEKIGKNYVGRSPNLLGVSVKAKTRDEAESKILEVIENRLNKFRELHSSNKAVTVRGQLEEVMLCVYQDRHYVPSDYQCIKPAQKEGLCWQHWKKLYGHAVGNKVNYDGCPLCGETNQSVLRRWESPCSFKAENPNWEEILEEKRRVKQSERLKEEREVRLKNLDNYPRCKASLNSGEQCSKLEVEAGFCRTHYNLQYGKGFQNIYRSEAQRESARNYFNNRFRKK
jgi:predicted RNase H-like HicB family nuclease